MAAEPISTTLGRYVSEFNLRDIPEHTRRKAALIVLDTLGAMLLGAQSRVGQIATGHAEKYGADGPCTVFGRSRTVGLEAAALANGTLGHVLELDDGHRPSDNHLGCVVVPAALAAGQFANASGADVVRAVVLGYDVMGRVGQAVCLPRMQSPFHHTGTTGGFGSAAAIGAVLGLDQELLANAFGIAATGASGLREVFASGTDCKSYQVGRGTANGANAVLMALAGMEGPVLAFEGVHGFVNAMTTHPRAELIASDLGTRFAVDESAFKIHAACGMLFTPVDAVLALHDAYDIDHNRVDSIDVALPGWVRDDPVFTKRRPGTPGEARFSVPYGVAAALVARELSVRQISDAGIADQEIARIEAKINVIANDEVDDIFEKTKEQDFFFYPTAITVHQDGRSMHRLERTPRGYDLARALTEDEVVAKYRGNVAQLMGDADAQRLAESVLDMESAPSLEFLTELTTLTAAVPAAAAG